jgi:hypothetical protein
MIASIKGIDGRVFWVASFLIAGLVTTSLFIPQLSDIFYAVSKPLYYLVLFSAFVGLSLSWLTAFRGKNLKLYVLAAMQLVCFGAYFSIIFSFYAGAYSGV